MNNLIISKKSAVIGAIVILAVIVGIWLGSVVEGKKTGANAASPYSVVYLSSGEIYFGKLSWFPKPHLSNPWTIQTSYDKDNKPQINVIPVNNAVWSPVDEMYLNKEQITAWSTLRADGDVAKLLANPEAARQEPAFQGPQAPPGSPTSR